MCRYNRSMEIIPSFRYCLADVLPWPYFSIWWWTREMIPAWCHGRILLSHLKKLWWHRPHPVTQSCSCDAQLCQDSMGLMAWVRLLSFTTCITFKQTMMCVGRLSQCSRGTVLVHTSLALLWFQFISEDFRNIGVKRMGRMQLQKGWNNALVVLKRFCTVL